MSWRDTLGVPRSPASLYTHNSQNTQNSVEPGNCADSADSAYRNPEEDDSRLLEALTHACRGLTIKPREVRDALASEDIGGWRSGDVCVETLAAFAASLDQRRGMERGTRPTSYSKQATCAQCGPIWLWTPGDVLGCPWCWNRIRGLPIPRPQPVQCAECRHWIPDSIGDGGAIGACAVGGPPPGQMPAYPRAERICDQWLPERGVQKGDPDGQ